MELSAEQLRRHALVLFNKPPKPEHIATIEGARRYKALWEEFTRAKSKPKLETVFNQLQRYHQ